ncbi:uncharacterized protein LOC113999876 [Pipra filicauda]|uniref:Uncharacterized protein LOC113999876 n=1 Tax=Pipra filicauda TaxID=649802 RepID=A0A6J2IHW2_9PASS|nr:uncharacterized protein LOC113999876 [Pipra filicauda]
MRRWRGAGLAALAAVLLVAAGRAQVQQEPLAQTPEGTEITINCSHPTTRTGDYIHWYRQLRGRGPQFLALIVQGSKELPDKAGQVSVSPDRRWSTLCLSGPRVGDAAVYYCAVGDTGRRARAAVGAVGTVEAGGASGGQRAPEESVLLSRHGSGFSFGGYRIRWYRRAPGGSLEWVSSIISSGNVMKVTTKELVKISKHGDSTTCLGNMYQGLVTLTP